MAVESNATATASLNQDEERPTNHPEGLVLAGNEGCFPFFKLARELRDKIYGEVTRNITLPVCKLTHGPLGPRKCACDNVECAQIEHAPCWQMLLVSKQFHWEYLKQLHRAGRSRLSISSEGVSSLQVEIDCGSPETFIKHLADVSYLDVFYSAFETYDLLELGGTMQYGTELRRVLWPLLPYLPKLHTITFSLCKGIRAIPPRMLRSEIEKTLAWAPAQSIRAALGPAFDRYHVDSSLVLEEFCFCTTKAEGYDLLPHPDNVVRYIATPSTGPYAWCGPDLAIIEELSYDLDHVENTLGARGDCDGNCFGHGIQRIGYKLLQ